MMNFRGCTEFHGFPVLQTIVSPQTFFMLRLYTDWGNKKFSSVQKDQNLSRIIKRIYTKKKDKPEMS